MLIFKQQHKDLIFTLINQLWRLVSGPVIMLLIPLFLSPEQQGYWYLFGSLAALSIFADLGFSNIILQFSAHEFAFLHFNSDGLLNGEGIYLQRLGSFFRFSIKWISTICAVVFPIIYFIGVVFFIRDRVLRNYFLPWTLYSIGSLVNFFNNSVLSFIEGLNKIEQIPKIRFSVAVFYTSTIVVILLLGGNVYALAFGMLLSASSIFISIFGIFRKLLKQLLYSSKGFNYPWKKEIIPLFAKYVVTFSSGYFGFHIYTPMMHYFHGAVYSGKVGISLSLVTAIFNMSNIWIYTVIPKINMLIAKGSWKELDMLFKKRLALSLGTYLASIIGLSVFLKILGNYWIIAKITVRFLPIMPIIMLFFTYFLQVFINAWALYLRGHKQEPFVVLSLILTVWIVTSTYLIGRFLAPTCFFLGFFTAYIWGTPVCYFFLFKKNKAKWHAG